MNNEKGTNSVNESGGTLHNIFRSKNYLIILILCVYLIFPVIFVIPFVKLLGEDNSLEIVEGILCPHFYISEKYVAYNVWMQWQFNLFGLNYLEDGC